MKRNLLKGIILISAVALSSCSTLNQLSKTSYTGDDVYFTKAQAGDSFDYTAAYAPAQNTIVRNDDYYYYGDYASRINRFSYYSPFSYDDDFYYGYDPYYSYSYNNYGYGPSTAPYYDYAYSPVYDLGVYSAYDYGYGDYWGYDNFGYGNAYSNVIFSGGVSKRSRLTTYPKASTSGSSSSGSSSGLSFSRGGTANGGATAIANGLSFSRGAATTNSAYPNSRPSSSSSVYPGRPQSNSSGQSAQTSTAVRTNNNAPIVRPISENPRPAVQQPVIERSSPPPSSSSSGGSSSGSSSSSGGGGRPVRP
jgi:uncharacterized membrane protein YgcG